MICGECKRKLSEYSEFQSELIENQTKLYQFAVSCEVNLLIASAHEDTTIPIREPGTMPEVVLNFAHDGYSSNEKVMTDNVGEAKTLKSRSVSDGNGDKSAKAAGKFSDMFKCSTCEAIFSDHIMFLEHLLDVR